MVVRLWKVYQTGARVVMYDLVGDADVNKYGHPTTLDPFQRPLRVVHTQPVQSVVINTMFGNLSQEPHMRTLKHNFI